jgi:hypothetical protein
MSFTQIKYPPHTGAHYNAIECAICLKFSQNQHFIRKTSKITTIAHNMEGCLRFSTFIFGISPNLVKYILMNDHHLRDITKLKSKHTHTHK